METERQQQCLQHAPCGILYIDNAGTIKQINPALEQMLGIPAERLLGGTAETLAAAQLDVLLQDAAQIPLVNAETGQQRWLQCSVDEGDSDTGSTRFYIDISEQVRLQQLVEKLQLQIEDLTITDPLTGLANRRALNQALTSQVTRSRRYHNPLSLAVIEIADIDNDDAELDDEVILAASRYLRDRLRWADLIGRWDHNHFTVILPETNAADGTVLLDKICSGFADEALPEGAKGLSLGLFFGLAEWQTGNDSRALMLHAAEDLNAGRATEQTPTTP